jgi:hypothetical protein
VDAHICVGSLGGVAEEGQAAVPGEEEITTALEADRALASREKKGRIHD